MKAIANAVCTPPYPKYYLYKRIVDSKLYIDSNYSASIHLNQLSDEALFSKYHFIRLFKKIVGLTPHLYLTKVRIEHAKNLLKENISVAETCEAIGFESISSFSGLFKRAVGKSPAAYLAFHQTLKSKIQETPLNYIPGCFAAKMKESQF